MGVIYNVCRNEGFEEVFFFFFTVQILLSFSPLNQNTSGFLVHLQVFATPKVH